MTHTSCNIETQTLQQIHHKKSVHRLKLGGTLNASALRIGNMVGRLDLSDSSVEVWRGSEVDLDSTATSISSFESEASLRKWGIAKSNENSAPNDNGKSFLEKLIRRNLCQVILKNQTHLVQCRPYSQHLYSEGHNQCKPHKLPAAY